MMKKLLLAICFFSISLFSASTPSSEGVESSLRTPDGRFDTKCYSWANDSRREFCEVSFYRLLATPEKYHGRLVGVVGFLVIVFGKPVLFANREAYEAGANYEGLVLVNPKLPAKIAREIRIGISHVVVVGVLDAKDIGDRIPRLGSLKDVENIAVMDRLPPRSSVLSREQSRVGDR